MNRFWSGFINLPHLLWSTSPLPKPLLPSSSFIPWFLFVFSSRSSVLYFYIFTVSILGVFEEKQINLTVSVATSLPDGPNFIEQKNLLSNLSLAEMSTIPVTNCMYFGWYYPVLVSINMLCLATFVFKQLYGIGPVHYPLIKTLLGSKLQATNIFSGHLWFCKVRLSR